MNRERQQIIDHAKKYEEFLKSEIWHEMLANLVNIILQNREEIESKLNPTLLEVRSTYKAEKMIKEWLDSLFGPINLGEVIKKQIQTEFDIYKIVEGEEASQNSK